MNKLLSLIVLCLPMISFASDCSTTVDEEVVQSQLEIKTDVPKHLKGATIIVRTADGKESVVPAEKFKVVPRKQQFIVNKTSQLQVTMCKAEVRKNRIGVAVGRGTKSGFDRSSTPNSQTVSTKVGDLGAAQYQRLVTERLSINGQVLSNDSGLIGVGWDF